MIVEEPDNPGAIAIFIVVPDRVIEGNNEVLLFPVTEYVRFACPSSSAKTLAREIVVLTALTSVCLSAMGDAIVGGMAGGGVEIAKV